MAPESRSEVPTLGTMQMIHAVCILFWHLPISIARCTMKSDRREHPQATRRQRGRAVTQRVTEADRVPAKARAERLRPPGEDRLRERRALPFPPAREDRIRFRCAEASGPWLNIRGRNRNDPGSRQLPTA
jgi:hypothetical protein